MHDNIEKKILQELENPTVDQKKHYQECLAKADGDHHRARHYYHYQRLAEENPTVLKNLDEREKWPMLLPLLILYTLGTIGVLLLVFAFLAGRLGWW